MQSYTFTAVQFLSVLTVIGQVIALVCIAILMKRKSKLYGWMTRNALLLMFIVAVVATSGSLFFSEIAGWVPCKDCWFQRIFMYPQVFLLALALWKRDKNIAIYILVLSLIGGGIAIDHYADQVELALHPVVQDSLVPCDASGVSCAETQIHFTFGYITIPMMALTAFVLNAVGSFALLLKRKTA